MNKALLVIISIFANLLSTPGYHSSRSNQRRDLPSSDNLTFEESDVYYDLKSDPEFDFDDYPLRKDLSDEKSIHGISLVEDNLEQLYLFLYNANGKDLCSNLSSARITMSTSPNYSETQYYPLSFIDATDDNLFYKFRIDYNFPTEFKNIRNYHLSEMEFNYGEGYSSGRHVTLAQSYIYTGQGDSLSYEQKKLETINLSISPGHYRFNTLNENSTTNEQHYWDMFYITFPINVDYGDLVGIKLAWQEKVNDIYLSNDEIDNFDFNNISEDYSKLSRPYIYEYTAEDLLNIDSLATINNFGKSFLVNLNPKNWFIDQDNNYDIPVIEKVIFDNENKSKFSNFYFNSDTINLLNNMYHDTVGGKRDIYTIRFSICDFTNSTYQMPNYSGSTTGFPSWYDKVQHVKYTEIVNCDVLTLTFMKDGKEYSLMASSEPKDYDPGIENPETKTWWEKLLELILNFIKEFRNFFENLVIVLGIIIGILGLALIIKFLKYIFK